MSARSERTDKTVLPYNELSDNTFFWHTLGLHLLCLISALLVSDITILFDLAGAITGAFSIFLIPAVLYLIASRRYGAELEKDDRETRLFKAAAWLFVVLGIFVIVLAIYLIVLRAQGLVKKESEAENTSASYEK